MKTIGIIPARSKSKRMPNKNWKSFARPRSIHGYVARKSTLTSIAAEKAVEVCDTVVISIDSRRAWGDACEIVRTIRIGKDSPDICIVIRPWRFPDDSVKVALHALEQVHAHDKDVYCFIQPTTPLITVGKIRETVARARRNRPAVAVNPAFQPNGGAYAGVYRTLKERGSFFTPKCRPIWCNWKESVDINYEHEFAIAKTLYAEETR